MDSLYLQLLFPWRYYELYLVDFLEDLDIEVSVTGEQCKCPVKDNHLVNRQGEMTFLVEKLYETQV
ncbi:MAG: hypothetical protein MUO60_16630, partial [Clostridiaceae bacterium]|nr:hypothetical protein [Clostridiaceae bacterium]